MSQMVHPYQHIYKRKDGSLGVLSPNDEPTQTQQQFKEDCDINNILLRFSQTGDPSVLRLKTQGAYRDLSQITNYHQMLNVVRLAEDHFANLPPDLRNKFNNDPSELVEFLKDQKNYDEGVKLGLIPSKIQNGATTNDDDLTTTNNVAPKISKKGASAPDKKPSDSVTAVEEKTPAKA